MMEFHYELDRDNRIVDVDEAWCAFAAENDCESLTRDKVLGLPLAPFLAGWNVMELYAAVFDRVRARQIAVTIPFRCDSPNGRRYMELEIAPRPEGRLHLTGHLVRSVAHPRIPLLDLKQRRNSQWRIICSICRRLKMPEGRWLEIEEALDDPYAIPAEGLPCLSHDVCPTCVAMMRGLAAP